MDKEGKGGVIPASSDSIPWRVEELRLIQGVLQRVLGKIGSLDALVSASPEIGRLLERVDELTRRLRVERIMSGACKPGKCVLARDYIDTRGREYEAELRQVQDELRGVSERLVDAERIAHILRADGPRIAVGIAIKSAPGARDVAYSYYDFANRAFVHTPAAEELLGIDPEYTEGVSLKNWVRLIKVESGERTHIFRAIKLGARLLHYEAETATDPEQKLYLTSSPRFYERGGRKIAIGVSVLPYDPSPEDRKAYASRPESTDAFFSGMNTLVDETNGAFANLVASASS
ncbi:hypothetical protein FJZ19_02770 [Candidatus Pacearchaeota archaeon]|nr:hypothetical protein [Candidatus Pacearchaeota archaeon]